MEAGKGAQYYGKILSILSRVHVVTGLVWKVSFCRGQISIFYYKPDFHQMKRHYLPDETDLFHTI